MRAEKAKSMCKIFTKSWKSNVFRKFFIEWLEEKKANNFQGKEIYTTFNIKGFHIFEKNGTI